MPSMTYLPSTRPVPPVHAVDIPLTPPTPAGSSDHIVAWAAHVQPGSPSQQKRRRPSISRLHLNLSSRNIQHGRARSGSSSFLNIIDTPSTGSHSVTVSPRNANQTPASSKSFEPSDLTNLGYTSVCLNLPPHTPEPAPAARPKMGRLTRIRSLSLLRSRSKSVSAAAPPPVSTIPPVPAIPPQFKSSAVHEPARVASRKKALYPNPKKGKAASKPTLPPTLANELELMQFMGGGSLESHAQRVMKARAKETAPAKHSNAEAAVGLGAVHRDEKGGLWWDRDEETEYAHLLAPSPTFSTPTTASSPSGTPSPPLSPPLSSPGLNGLDWVRFPCSSSPGKENLSPLRRGSFTDANASIVRAVDDSYRYTPHPVRTRRRSRSRSRSRSGSVTASKPRARRPSVSGSATGPAAGEGRRSRHRPAPLDLARARNAFVTSSFAPPVPAISGSVSAALPGRFARPSLPFRYSDPTDVEMRIQLPAQTGPSNTSGHGLGKTIQKKASRLGFWKRG